MMPLMMGQPWRRLTASAVGSDTGSQRGTWIYGPINTGFVAPIG
jgi:hypothetical protein